MSNYGFSSFSEFDDTALGWATDHGFVRPRKPRNVLLDLLLTRFGKTSRRAARAVRDFVTCSSPQSSGFSGEDVNTPQESRAELRDSPAAITSKPLRDVYGSTSPPRGLNNKERHPHRGAAKGETSLRTRSAEATSTSSCEPKLPINFFELPTRQRLRALKQFLAGFVYKPNSEPSFQSNKQRPLCRLMATARRIVYKPEPIKAVEAVFLALYLTAGLVSVDRIPVGFKTKFANKESQHTVVVVQHNDKFGAFGISPNPDLMTKDFQFDSMSSIIEDYLKAYKASACTVLKIRIGLRVEHDVMSSHFICWRHLCLSPDSKSWAECVVHIENHMLRMRHLWDLWILTGKGHDPHKVDMVKKLDSRGKPVGSPGEMVSEVKKHVEMSSRVQPSPVLATKQHWDAESTGSNAECEECEDCAQLKRAMPPVDTKRASVTTVKKRRKESGDLDTTRFIPEGKRFTHSPSDPEQHWEAESLGSNTGDALLKPSIRCQANQALKHWASSSVMSTPPPRRRGSKDMTRLVDRNESGRKRQAGAFHNFSSGGRKCKAG